LITEGFGVNILAFTISTPNHKEREKERVYIERDTYYSHVAELCIGL
jgi:hypothetical protein